MTCRRCVTDETIDPDLKLDTCGICNWCNWQAMMEIFHPKSEKQLAGQLKQIKGEGDGEYDCVIGVSGGQDSTWLLHRAKEAGLTPLAVHYDNTFNSIVAVENLMETLKKLEVDLDTYVADDRDVENIAGACMRAGIPDLDMMTDIALTTCMYKAAEKAGTKWILDAHDFRSEGTTPFGVFYFDQRYLDNVVLRHGIYTHDKYWNGWRNDFGLPLEDQLNKWWPGGYKRLRPLYYDPTPRAERRKTLEDLYNWTPYAGKHMENRWTEFVDYYWLPERFGIDLRKVFWSAQVRSREITKEQAIVGLEKPALGEKERDDLVREICDRLRIGYGELYILKNSPRSNYRYFDNYLPEFKKRAEYIKTLAEAGNVPRTFYEKYCKG